MGTVLEVEVYKILIGNDGFKNWAIPSLYSIKAGTRRIDGSEKLNVSDVTITEKDAGFSFRACIVKTVLYKISGHQCLGKPLSL